MRYNFSPTAKDERARSFLNKRGRQIVLSVAVLIVISLFYFAGTTITTYATYNKNLEQELEGIKADVVLLESDKESCNNLLRTSNNELQNCNNGLLSSKSSLTTCLNDKNKLNEEVDVLSSAVETCENKIISSNTTFKQLARNSVRPICCSFGDMQNGAVRNWDVINNSITCSGVYTINCATGETNY